MYATANQGWSLRSVTALCSTAEHHSWTTLSIECDTHTHVWRPFSGTTLVSWYQNGKTNLDSTEARDSEWQWHQLGHIQVCTSLQTDNHTSTPLLSFYRPYALPATQPTASKHIECELFVMLYWLEPELADSGSIALCFSLSLWLELLICFAVYVFWWACCELK